MAILVDQLYVSRESRIDLVAARLNHSLSLSLRSRDSTYWGDYYLDRSGPVDEIRLYRNQDPRYLPGRDAPEDYWFESEFRDYPLLLHVSGVQAAVELFSMKLWNACPSFDFVSVRTITCEVEEDR